MKILPNYNKTSPLPPIANEALEGRQLKLHPVCTRDKTRPFTIRRITIIANEATSQQFGALLRQRYGNSVKIRTLSNPTDNNIRKAILEGTPQDLIIIGKFDDKDSLARTNKIVKILGERPSSRILQRGTMPRRFRGYIILATASTQENVTIMQALPQSRFSNIFISNDNGSPEGLATCLNLITVEHHYQLPIYPPPGFLACGVENKTDVNKALSCLFSAISEKWFIPSLSEEEANNGFLWIRLGYGGGRYAQHLPKNMGDWKDLLGNIGGRIKLAAGLITRNGRTENTTRILELATTQLTVIEHWFYYHPEEWQTVVKLFGISSQTSN